MAEALSKLYSLFEKLEDSKKAYEFVKVVVESALLEMEYEKVPFSPEELEKRVVSVVQDYLEVAEKLKIA